MNEPTRPAYHITVDGHNIGHILDERLISLTLTDNKGFEADQLDITLDDADGRLDLPPRGAEIRVSIGWEGGGLVDKGSYTVDEVEHSGAPDVLTIRARSADLRGGLVTQMERSFHCQTLGGIVRAIADENGLTPLIAPALEAQFIEHIDQTNESSANLLTRLAGMFNAIATVKNDRLMCMPAGQGKSASGKRIPAVIIRRQDGDSHRFGIAERDTYTAVRATYYDTHAGTKGEVVWGAAEEAAAKNKPVASPQAESAPKLKALQGKYKSRALAIKAAKKAWTLLKKKPGDLVGVKAAYDDRVNKVSGEVSWGRADEAKQYQNAAHLAEKDAAKIHGADKPSIDHSADNVKTIRHVYASKENAKRSARSEYLKLGRGLASFSITLAKGRPELFPEVPATVRGFKPSIDSTDWIVSRAIHNLSDSGYTTAIELEIRESEMTG